MKKLHVFSGVLASVSVVSGICCNWLVSATGGPSFDNYLLPAAELGGNDMSNEVIGVRTLNKKSKFGEPSGMELRLAVYRLVDSEMKIIHAFGKFSKLPDDKLAGRRGKLDALIAENSACYYREDGVEWRAVYPNFYSIACGEIAESVMKEGLSCSKTFGDGFGERLDRVLGESYGQWIRNYIRLEKIWCLH